MAPKLHAGIGAISDVMLKFILPSKPIRDNYPNQTKKHKLEGVVLVEEDMKVVRRGADVIPVFVFTHDSFPDKLFYSTKRYIHVTQEVTEESLFVLAETPAPDTDAGDIGALAVDRNNHTDGAEAKKPPNLLWDCTSNLR